MLVISIVIVVAVVLCVKLYMKYITKWCKSKVCLVGKTVIITGGNAGIGYETALELAKRGAKIILACRDVTKGTAAVENIKNLTKNPNVFLKLVDLSSFKSINNFANDINKTEERIDILINNAGAWGLGDNMTEDGLQLVWEINHYGPVLLTLRLLELLKSTRPSRIINLSSMAARYATLSLNNLHELNTYQKDYEVYGNTKLANILFTQKLAKLLKDTQVSVFSVHPGVVETEIVVQRLPFAMMYAMRVAMKLFFLSPEEGAQTTIYLACEDGIEHLSGRHFEYCSVVDTYKTAKDPNLADEVWNRTLELIKYDKDKMN
ncbi:unnamed protein product [Phyllotreta striolata]|uniref:Uncharacterized protein n=1 Tax=Phyllotreta striolata TaxID=444603 RepID=A0A9N9TSN5_PHYSR|nr:unnamed protein product [Phyllotreta striolata]